MDKRTATALGLVIPVLGFLSMGPLTSVFPEPQYGPLGIALACAWAVPAQLLFLFIFNVMNRRAMTGRIRMDPVMDAEDPEETEPPDEFGTRGQWEEFEKLDSRKGHTRKKSEPVDAEVVDDETSWVPYSDQETAAREPGSNGHRPPVDLDDRGYL